MAKSKGNTLPYILITLLGGLLFVPFLGMSPLFDWDEINFAESAREMLVSGNFSTVQINFEPFWEKPPLFIWMQSLSMMLFGVGEFAARFPNALCGIITLNVLFYIGKRHINPSFGLFWVLCYMGAMIPNLYFRSGIIDPVFNLFIFLGIYQFYLASLCYEGRRNNALHFFLAGLFLGLAVLTKGPVAILVAGLCFAAFMVAERFRIQMPFRSIIAFLFAFVLVVFSWFGPETIKNGPWFIVKFIQYQAELMTQNVAGHQQPWYYHTMVLLFGCFPISALAIPGFLTDKSTKRELFLLHRWMMILFFVVLILFSIVKTKIVHYSSLCWLPLTFMAAHGVIGIFTGKRRGLAVSKVLLGLTVVVVAALFTAVPLLAANSGFKQMLVPYIKDCAAVESLMLNGRWFGFEMWLGLAFGLVLLVLCFAYIFRTRGELLMWLLILNMLFVTAFSALMVPGIESHSQGSIIRFYESMRGRDVYVKNIGFKSYAPYFYLQIKPGKTALQEQRKQWLAQYGAASSSRLSDEQRNEFEGRENDWLMKGPADKPVYIVTKCNYKCDFPVDTWQNVLSTGGFRVWKRMPATRP